MCSYSFPTSIMCQKNVLSTVVCVLVVVGALNWGLVGLGWLVGNGADWNVVQMILGTGTVTAVVYVLIGLAGVYKLAMCSKCCGSSCGASKPM